VWSTRGPMIRDFQATEHTLAMAEDDLATVGNCVDEKMLAGLNIAKSGAQQ